MLRVDIDPDFVRVFDGVQKYAIARGRLYHQIESRQVTQLSQASARYSGLGEILVKRLASRSRSNSV